MGQERVKQMNLTDEQVEAWKRAFELAGVDLDALGECLLKIAKALGVHLRDLSDNSWLEEFDQQHPDAVENAKRGLAVIQYLEEMGFTISSQVLKWHWENENDPPEERVQIADEILTVLSKDGHTATFTDAEFEELQAGAKEAIEGRFYKKVLEQQKK